MNNERLALHSINDPCYSKELGGSSPSNCTAASRRATNSPELTQANAKRTTACYMKGTYQSNPWASLADGVQFFLSSVL